MKATVKTILMLMMVVLMIAPVRAQVETGSISGTVRDTSGAAVAGASTGFAKFTSRVEVTVGSSVTVDPQLSVGNQTTTIEVVAAGGVEVNTQNQELSQVINTQQMEQLPSLTRNPYDFVQIAGN